MREETSIHKLLDTRKEHWDSLRLTAKRVEQSAILLVAAAEDSNQLCARNLVEDLRQAVRLLDMQYGSLAMTQEQINQQMELL